MSKYKVSTDNAHKHTLLNRFVCFIVGHKQVPMLYEDDNVIHTKGCSRCGVPLGLPDWWKGADAIPMPARKGEAKIPTNS